MAEGTEITDAEIDTLREALTVMKMKKAGKYRHKKKKTRGSDTWQEQCKACLRKHTPSRRCPAVGRTCFDCNSNSNILFKIVKNCKHKNATTLDYWKKWDDSIWGGTPALPYINV